MHTHAHANDVTAMATPRSTSSKAMRVKALTALIVTPALLYLAINAAGTSSSSTRLAADATAEAATAAQHKVEAQPTAAAGTLTQASAVIGPAQHHASTMDANRLRCHPNGAVSRDGAVLDASLPGTWELSEVPRADAGANATCQVVERLAANRLVLAERCQLCPATLVVGLRGFVSYC